MLFAAIITSLMGAFTVVSAGVAKPAVKEHFDCEYTGVLPGTVATGTCVTGGEFDQGYCHVPELKSRGVEHLLCDYQFKNTPTVMAHGDPCNPGNVRQTSQFACKGNGNFCSVHMIAEAQNVVIAHCT